MPWKMIQFAKSAQIVINVTVLRKGVDSCITIEENWRSRKSRKSRKKRKEMKLLICPNCNKEIEIPEVGSEIICENCHTVYEVIEIDGVLDLMLVEEEEWPGLPDPPPLEDSSSFCVAIGYILSVTVMITLFLASFFLLV